MLARARRYSASPGLLGMTCLIVIPGAISPGGDDAVHQGVLGSGTTSPCNLIAYLAIVAPEESPRWWWRLVVVTSYRRSQFSGAASRQSRPCAMVGRTPWDRTHQGSISSVIGSSLSSNNDAPVIVCPFPDRAQKGSVRSSLCRR